MSAYAIAQRGQPYSAGVLHALRRHDDAAPRADVKSEGARKCARTGGPQDQLPVLDALIEDLVQRIAAAVTAQLAAMPAGAAEWLDTRGAAEYLGVHRDTLRKLAAERAIPAQQDGPGCKLFFRCADLDEWRLSGGRDVQLSSVLPDAA